VVPWTAIDLYFYLSKDIHIIFEGVPLVASERG